MPKKLTLEIVKAKLKLINEHITILSKEYKGAHEKLECKCDVCGKVWGITWRNLHKGAGCSRCAGTELLTLRLIKERLRKINSNISIVSKEYINNKEKLCCKCKICGHEWETPWCVLRDGGGCPNCAIKKNTENKRFTIEYVNRKINEIDDNISIVSKEYINSKEKLCCKCKICGHEWETKWNLLQNKHGCPPCASKKQGLKIRGERHYKYNALLTKEERKKKRKVLGESYQKWRKEVYERDEYTCQCCGDDTGGNLIAHHLNGYDNFPDLRTEITNGVTLCKKCHDKKPVNKYSFHSMYGNGNNTKEQYDEWILFIKGKIGDYELKLTKYQHD